MDFDRAVREHDAVIAARGGAIWVGGEPTFTRRLSFEPAWTSAVDGDDKQARARRVAERLARRFGAVVFRSIGVGREPESEPAWAWGLYERRDGQPIWRGPPDPLLADDFEEPRPSQARALRDALAAVVSEREGRVFAFDDPDGCRLLSAPTEAPDLPSADDEALTRRPRLRGAPAEFRAAASALARRGLRLFVARVVAAEGLLELELPPFKDPDALFLALSWVEEAARRAGVSRLVLAGFPPPVDDRVAWTTIVPDKGVIEVNLAPAADMSEYLARYRALTEEAAAEDLGPRRYLYDGSLSPSGGGQHLTLGGPSAEASPFAREPRLLPRMICVFQRHPCLSYLFAGPRVGGAGPAPRVDEGLRQGFCELRLAVGRLMRAASLDPEQVARGLAHILADASGSRRRSEINIEKFWGGGPGERRGLVELRALGMPPSPESAVARAALFRSIVAWLAVDDEIVDGELELEDWGAQLHDRFALPFHLEADLRAVLARLSERGFGLGEAIAGRLFEDDARRLGEARLGGVRLRVRRALEFWPALAGGRGRRRLDTSARRIEIILEADAAELSRWRVLAGGWELPMPRADSARGPARVGGLRYRAFAPPRSVHPGAPACDPLVFVCLTEGQAHEVSLFNWRPDGGAYDGLPEDTAEAEERRRERFVVRALEPDAIPEPRRAPREAISRFGLDLRWMQACDREEG